MVVGGQGRVTPGEPNRLRLCADTSCSQIDTIPGGGQFTVVDGPRCNDGYTWWEVQYRGTTGWTADNGTWLEPVSSGSSGNIVSTQNNLGRNCSRNENGTVTCWALGVKRESNMGDHYIVWGFNAYTGILEIPNGAENVITSVTYETLSGVILYSTGHCGGVTSFEDDYSGSRWVANSGFQLVQGCVRGLNTIVLTKQKK